MGRKNIASVVDLAEKRINAIYSELDAKVAEAGLHPQASNKDECIKNIFAYMQEQRLEVVLKRTKFNNSQSPCLPKSHKRYTFFSTRQEDVADRRKASIGLKLFEQDQQQENPIIGVSYGGFTGYAGGNGRRASWLEHAAAGKLGNRHKDGLWMLLLTGKKYDTDMKLVEVDDLDLLEHVQWIAGEANRNVQHGRQPEAREDLAQWVTNQWTLKREKTPECVNWDEDTRKKWGNECLSAHRPDPYACATMATARSTIVNMVFCEDIRQEHKSEKPDADFWGEFWPTRQWNSDSAEEQVTSSTRRLYKRLSWSTSKHQTLRLSVLHCEEGVLTDAEIQNGPGTDVNLLLSVGDKKRGKRISSATTLKTQRSNVLTEIGDHNTHKSYASGYFRKYPLIKRVLFEQQLRGCKPEAWEWNEEANEWESIAPVAAEA
jgi:hypothetical protein